MEKEHTTAPFLIPEGGQHKSIKKMDKRKPCVQSGRMTNVAAQRKGHILEQEEKQGHNT